MPAPRLLSRIACAAALAAALGTAGAAPPEVRQPDDLLQMLQQRGLLPADGAGNDPGVVQQVRDAASDLVISAMNFLGVPYRRGGDSAAKGFDCSGFTRHVFEHTIGLALPRRVDEQASAPGVVRIGRDELRPGDLVFFNTLRRTFSHVGIYIGEGRFIHAPRSGAEVRVEDMRKAYWAARFTGARRVAALGDAADAAAPGRR